MEKIKSKKIKILIATPLYPPEIGGPATYVRFLEENLPKDQFSLRIVKFSEVKKLPYIIRHIVFFWMVFKRSKGGDIIYALDPLGVGLPSGLAAKLRGKKFLLRIAGDRAWETAVQKWKITDSLDNLSVKKSYPIFLRILKFAQTCTAKMAWKIIVPGKYLSGIVSSWGIPHAKIFSIYNAFSPVSMNISKDEIRKELGLSGFIIVSAGRLVPWKGFATLIQTMPEILKEIPDAKLYIIGDGPDKQKLRSIVQFLNLEKSVRFTGVLPKSELHRYIKSADVFALNTSYEGFSHQILEAMSLSTPVITTTSGGNPEMIESGVGGLLVTHDDARAFASSIILLSMKKEYSAMLAQKAKEKSETFNVIRAVSEFMEVLHI